MGIEWLGGSLPQVKRGISWGIPWQIGELEPKDVLSINELAGQPIQTSVMAFWPDGSVKWTRNSGVFSKEDSNLKFTQSGEKLDKYLTTDKYNGVYVDTGKIQVYFPKHGEGSSLIEWLKIDDEIRLEQLKLIAQVKGNQIDSTVKDVSVEENGPIKTVIKVTGIIKDKQEVLQEFILRFRFFKDLSTIDITHTIIINSNQSIEGIGLTYKAAIEGENWNRHVRFAGDTSMYNEPAQLFLSRRFAVENKAYEKQVKGEIVELSNNEQGMLAHAKENAIWNSFSMNQLSDNSFELSKKTSLKHGKVTIGYGKRSNGLLYAGGVNGGVACSMPKFWQKHPSQLTVDNLTEKRADMTAWFWSPESQEIDFTHYSSRDHMLSAYEGMEEIRSTPIGIANTSELSLTIFDAAPTDSELWDLAIENQDPARLVMSPEDYYQTKVFGVWSLKDESTPIKSFLEKQITDLRSFYQLEIEQRNWYGYWNYGDVMHTYDPYRHVWRYDMGGYAWQNTELVPNMWLWQDFLRSGSKDAFELAEAMTIHTAEVDQYHLGEYQGLGSRHNVLHWGCQCKEVRMSMAGLHRYYYYLTCDERMGDILKEVSDNESAFERLEPLREFYEREDEETVPIRVGPDWAGMTSNWFTNWELTGNKEYRDNILTGIRSIESTPHKLVSGPTYQFELKSKKLNYYGTGNVGGYHMIISFGAPQVWLEIAESIKDEGWNKMLADFGKFYSLTDEEKRKQSDGLLDDTHFSWPLFATGMMAYGANYYKDKELARKAWEILLTPTISGFVIPIESEIREVETWKKIKEIPWISTNVVSQWCLNIMLCLELIGDDIPTDILKVEE